MTNKNNNHNKQIKKQKEKSVSSSDRILTITQEIIDQYSDVFEKLAES